MQKQSVKYQYLAAIVVGLFKLTDGMLIGWVSPNLLLLESDDTPLSEGKITGKESSWISSLMPIGSTVGTLLYGFILKRFGRKYPLIALVVPSIVGWLLSIFAKTVSVLYIARLIHGFTIGGSYVVAPVYLIEIADDRIRGILGASIMINENIGVMIAFAIAGFSHYSVLPIVAIVLNLLFLSLYVWFPETPSFLLSRNKIKEAEKSIRFYRNVRDADSNVVEVVMGKLKRAIESMNGENAGENRLKLSDIITRPGSKAMLIAFVLVLLNQCSGVFAMLNNAGTIFKDSGSALSANLSAVIVQGIQSVGTCFVTILIERAGRRFLYITSCIGTACGYIVYGVYVLLKQNGVEVETFNWIPIVSFSFILFISSFAVATLTFPVASELLPLKLREFGITFCAILLGLLAFAVLKMYDTMKETLGNHTVMFIFAGVCIAGAVFLYFTLPEIKGKSYEEIMNKLR